jgi:hypothetical protein
VLPTKVIGRMDPLPTTMDGGTTILGGRTREMLSGLGVVWFDAPESVTHFVSAGDVWSVIVLKESASDYWSHEPCQGI